MNWWVISTKTFVELNFIQLFLILASTVTGRGSISAFASLLCIPLWILSSAIRLKNCEITAGSKKYRSIIKKKKKIHEKIVLLAKYKLKRIAVLISKVLTDSSISLF